MTRQGSAFVGNVFAVLLFSNVGVFSLAWFARFGWERRLVPALLVPVAAAIGGIVVYAITHLAAKLHLFHTCSPAMTGVIHCVALLLAPPLAFPIGLVDIDVVMLAIVGVGVVVAIAWAAFRHQPLGLLLLVGMAYLLLILNLTSWSAALSDTTGGEAGIGIFTYAGLLSGLSFLFTAGPETDAWPA